MNRTAMFLIFFSVVTCLFALMQYRLFLLYRAWVHRSIDAARQSQWLKYAKWFLLFANLHFVSRFFLAELGIYEHPLSQIVVVYPGGLFFAAMVLSFLLTISADIVRFPFKGIAKLRRRITGNVRVPDSMNAYDESRRRFLKRGGLSAAALVGSIPVIASAATARDYQLRQIPLEFQNLPPGLDGLKVAQISDLHAGLYMTEHDMREIFELTNSLGADLIVMTGDFVDTADSQIEPLYKALAGLKADFGIFGCLGNHDHFATAEKVSAAIRRRGIILLNNAHTIAPINGEELAIIGIDDAGRGSANFARMDQALHGVSPNSFKMMLTHRPDVWDECRSLGMDLTLAGHTHGGQVGFQLGPLNLNPVYLVHKYAMGHYEKDGKHLYVNVGVGMVGVPIRMVKPEIALFTLRSSR